MIYNKYNCFKGTNASRVLDLKNNTFLPDVFYVHHQQAGITTKVGEGLATVVYGKDNRIPKEDYINAVKQHGDFSEFKLTHDGFKFSISDSSKAVGETLIKELSTLNREQTVKVINDLVDNAPLLNVFGKATDVVTASKFKKLTANVMRILAADTFKSAVLLEAENAPSKDKVREILEFVNMISKLIRDSNVTKDPLTFEFLKKTSSVLKTDKDCVN